MLLSSVTCSSLTRVYFVYNDFSSGDVEESIKKGESYKFDKLMLLSRTAEPVAASSGDKQTLYCQTEEQCFSDVSQ